MRPISIAFVFTLLSATTVSASVPCRAEIGQYVGASAAEITETRLALMSCLAREQALQDALLDEIANGGVSEKSFVVVDTEPAAFGLFVAPGDEAPGLGQPDAPGTMFSCRCPENGGAAGYEGLGLEIFRPSTEVFEGLTQPTPRLRLRQNLLREQN